MRIQVQLNVLQPILDISREKSEYKIGEHFEQFFVLAPSRLGVPFFQDQCNQCDKQLSQSQIRIIFEEVKNFLGLIQT